MGGDFSRRAIAENEVGDEEDGRLDDEGTDVVDMEVEQWEKHDGANDVYGIEQAVAPAADQRRARYDGDESDTGDANGDVSIIDTLLYDPKAGEKVDVECGVEDH